MNGNNDGPEGGQVSRYKATQNRRDRCNIALVEGFKENKNTTHEWGGHQRLSTRTYDDCLVGGRFILTEKNAEQPSGVRALQEEVNL